MAIFKDWRDYPDITTPITATALEDLELRVGAELVTAFPGSPTTGKEVLFQTSGMASLSPPVAWRCYYDGTEWIPIGGPALYAEITTFESSTTMGSFVALTTAGPSVALPVAGDYLVAVGARARTTGGNGALDMSYDIGGTSASANDSWNVDGTSGNFVTSMREMKKTGLTAVTLTAKYRGTSPATGHDWSNRWMRVTPLRLG